MDRLPLVKWPEIERWLLTALDYPESERSDFLEQVCPENLKSLVRSLIRGLDDPSSREGRILDEERIQTVAASATAQMSTSRPLAADVTHDGDLRVGTYRLVRLLGRGGMGEVYLSERLDGHTPRWGALKILRVDLESEDAILRFRRERVLLAAVDSIHVPRLLDAGTTADGRPYYVMEVVEGEPITTYVRRVQPSFAERLDLISEACEAVRQIHAQKVIHRDIKPSNLFVCLENGVARIKLLDFGVATVLRKDAEPEGMSVLSLTRDGMAPHTPEFAAPEQLNGEVTTSAVDIHALGVLFCLLVTEHRPRTRRGFPFCAQSDGTHPCRLSGICSVAAHPEPTQRFGSADDLARAVLDIRTHIS